MSKVDLSKYKKLWKTKKAFDLLTEEEKELREEIVSYYRPKTGKTVTSVSWKNLADAVFSEYCRLYYCDDEGNVRCITSGVKMPRYKSQCGHFISRGINKYRYDILNCYPQSYAENVMLSGNYKVYTLKMIDMLGKKKVEEMINDKEEVSYNQARYEGHIKERYKFITEKKALIKKKPDKVIHGIENMEF